MQKRGRCSSAASQSNDGEKLCMTSSLFSSPSFLSFLVPFLLLSLVCQALGLFPEGPATFRWAPGLAAGLIGVVTYCLLKSRQKQASRRGFNRQMPILADYMRKTNLTISQLEGDENSALAPGSKEN